MALDSEAAMARREIVLGAGPAGLSAARELARAGLRPLVLERSHMLGGISRTEEWNGCRFDIGGHRFFTAHPEVGKIWRELLGKDMLTVPRRSCIFYDGRFLEYPLRPRNILSELGWVESLRAAGSYLKARVANSSGQSFESWVVSRFGRRLFEMFFKPYTEKIWGRPCSEIPASWADQRIRGLSFRSALAGAIFGGKGAKSTISSFEYPRLGPGMLWEAMRREIESHGGEVLLEAEATRVELGAGGSADAVCWRRQGQEYQAPVNHLISSIPLTALIGMMTPTVSADVLDTARDMPYRDFMFVFLIVERPDLFDEQWIYVHNPDLTVGRVQNIGNWSREMLSDSHISGVGMEYFCSNGDALWSMSDAGLVAKAAGELAALGCCDRSDIREGIVVRQPQAYPVYTFDHEQRLGLLRQCIEAVPNLQVAGRNAMHRYNNMDHSLLTGLLAARNVLGESHDLWTAEPDEYLEQGIENEAVLENVKRLDPVALGAAFSAIAGLGIVLLTLLALWGLTPDTKFYLGLLNNFYPGYSITWPGVAIGMLWAAATGYAAGLLLAAVRNLAISWYVFQIRRKSELLTIRDFFDRL